MRVESGREILSNQFIQREFCTAIKKLKRDSTLPLFNWWSVHWFIILTVLQYLNQMLLFVTISCCTSRMNWEREQANEGRNVVPIENTLSLFYNESNFGVEENFVNISVHQHYTSNSSKWASLSHIGALHVSCSLILVWYFRPTRRAHVYFLGKNLKWLKNLLHFLIRSEKDWSELFEILCTIYDFIKSLKHCKTWITARQLCWRWRRLFPGRLCWCENQKRKKYLINFHFTNIEWSG